jgi:hypothetical protein
MKREEVVNKFAQKGKIKVIKGTILAPETGNLKLILNLLDMSERPSSPLLDLFDKKWKKVREEAKGWYARRENFKLGAISTTAVQSDVWVVNLLCRDKDGNLDVTGLSEGLKKIANMALYEKAGVHVSTKLVEMVTDLNKFLDTYLIQKGVSVYCYEEPIT